MVDLSIAMLVYQRVSHFFKSWAQGWWNASPHSAGAFECSFVANVGDVYDFSVLYNSYTYNCYIIVIWKLYNSYIIVMLVLVLLSLYCCYIIHILYIYNNVVRLYYIIYIYILYIYYIYIIYIIYIYYINYIYICFIHNIKLMSCQFAILRNRQPVGFAGLIGPLPWKSHFRGLY